MVGLTMTYRQAIEQLGAAQYAQSLASAEAKRGADDLTEAQKFAEQQQRSLEEGFVDAIMSADSFADALKNLAIQLIAAQAQALLMQGLFNSGPLGSGGGGGLLSGLSRLFSFEGGGFTGNGPRSGGLDGKGGYLAMVHPNETVIDHARGQRAGGATFATSTTINVQGSVDERTMSQLRRELDERDARLKAQVPGIMQNFQIRAG